MKNPFSIFLQQNFKDTIRVRQYYYRGIAFFKTIYTFSDVRPKARIQSYCKTLAGAMLFAVLLTVRQHDCQAQSIPEVNLSIIAQIESSGRASAVGDGGKSLGKFQLSSAVFSDYNKANKTRLNARSCALDALCSEAVADWYLHTRIPQMLSAYKVPVTVSNILVAYNAGIKSAKLGRIPPVTKNYLIKYKRLGGTL